MTTTQAAEAKTFDTVMKKVWDEGHKLDAIDVNAPPTPAPKIEPVVTPETPPVDAPVQPDASTGQPTSIASPPTSPAPARPDDGVARALTMIAETQARTQQMFEAQMRALQPAQPQPKPRTPPTTDEALLDFRMPLQKQGEAQAAYDLRVQSEVLNHIRAKDREYVMEDARNVAQSEANKIRQEYAQQAEQRAAADRYANLLGETVTKAGYQAGSNQAKFVRDHVDRTLTALHLAGVTAQWGEPQWRYAAQLATAEVAAVVAPPPAPGAKPALSVVPNAAPAAAPPISGGGSTSPGTAAPPQKSAKKPGNFWEAMENVWKESQAS